MGQIFGVIALTADAEPATALAQIERRLNFWQADAQDHYVDQHAGIGSRLLHNTPESRLERLPSMCPQQRYVLSCIARLDNREELAAHLGYDTHTINQIPDGQFILDAYIKWQETCVQHLIGDFAIAVWDRTEKKLFLARDHIGVKPVFYMQTDQLFMFASDPNAFKDYCDPLIDLDEQYLAKALARTPNQVAATCYRNVHRLEPAKYYIFRDRQLTAQVYWELAVREYPEVKTEADYYHHFRELLYQAVNCRLRSVWSIGCELSGGLDSSAVTMAAAQLLGPDIGRLHTLSYVMPEEGKRFSDDWVDEEPEQDTIIQAGKILPAQAHKLTWAWFDDPFEEMDYSTQVNGGISDTDNYWTEALRRKARQHDVRVVLSGFAGDELVSASGGTWFHELIARKEYHSLWPLIVEKPMERMKGLAACLYRHYVQNPEAAILVDAQRKANFLAPQYTHLLPLEQFPSYLQSMRTLGRMGITRAHTSLRMESEGLYALRNQMEVRYPLADIRLLQFAYSLPRTLFKDARQTRHVFRKATEGILPDKVRLRQNKKGAPLVFNRVKLHRDQIAFLEHYTPPVGPALLINTEKLLQTIQDNLKHKKTEAPSAIRFAYWLMRFSRQTMS